MDVVVGIALLVLGAASASIVNRALEEGRHVRWLPLALVPPGVLIGAGGAVVRGWDVVGSMAVGAVVVPFAGGVMAVVQRRRVRRTS